MGCALDLGQPAVGPVRQLTVNLAGALGRVFPSESRPLAFHGLLLFRPHCIIGQAGHEEEPGALRTSEWLRPSPRPHLGPRGSRSQSPAPRLPPVCLAAASPCEHTRSLPKEVVPVRCAPRSLACPTAPLRAPCLVTTPLETYSKGASTSEKTRPLWVCRSAASYGFSSDPALVGARR